MIAEKRQGNKFHIFDTTRLDIIDMVDGDFKLNKKAGNYIGKIRRDKNDKASYSLFDHAKEEKEQIAAFVYDSKSILSQWKDGQPPRRLQIAIPFVDENGSMESLAPYLKNKMIDSIKRKTTTGIKVYTAKEPAFERGQYRLNFNGRVTMPSVKNMQIVDKDGEVFAQFGKVGEHRFHLDYKHPFNALQVFAMALTAMDL